jgi:phage terminase small subunit
MGRNGMTKIMDPAQVPDGSAPLRTAQREKFAQVLAGGTMTQADAYRQAYPVSVAWKSTSVDGKAAQLMQDATVRARVQWLQRQAAENVVMTRAEALALVLADARAVVAADASELTRWRCLNCRHCWGEGHAYRWRNDREYWKALEAASAEQERWDNTPENKRRGQRPELPTDDGGYGFRRTDEVNPDCPECEGEGIEDTKIGDTRKLSKNARVLYDGVKQTKNGIEIKQRDKEAARALLAKYAGIADTVDVKGGLAVAAVTAAVTPEQAAAIAKKLAEDY